MPKYPTCIFCRRNDSPPHKEDILAKWIAREFPDGRKSKFLMQGGYANEPEPERKFHTRGHLGMVTDKVCQRCNNGWMSDLEKKTQPFLRPMMDGERITIPTDQQLWIARWFFKVAVLYEFWRERSPRYFKPAERVAFFKSLTIPNHTYMYLGHYVGSLASSTTDIDNPFIVSPNTPNATSTDAYSVTLSIKQLALQVFSFRWPENHRSNISFKLPGAWDTAHIQIRPIEGNKNWPPPAAFDDKAMTLFEGRWLTIKP
jgi:hypothetical protein